MALEPYVYQLFAGKVKKIGTPGAKDPFDREWETGMFKDNQEEMVYLTKTGLVGDEVADTKNHGGPEKALFAYPIGHYKYWNEVENIPMEYGGMGENLAVLEMDESSVFIGDTYEFGEAIIQVSQPRQPCWRPARRYRDKQLALKIQNTGLTGWYYRVLQEGYVEAKTDLKLVDRPYPQWSIAAANEVMHLHKDNLRLADELGSCELLATNWQRTLKNRVQGKERSLNRRVYGPNLDA